MQTLIPEQENPTEGMDFDMEVFSSKELAYHMTLFDWDLFWSVHEVSYITEQNVVLKNKTLKREYYE